MLTRRFLKLKQRSQFDGLNNCLGSRVWWVHYLKVASFFSRWVGLYNLLYKATLMPRWDYSQIAVESRFNLHGVWSVFDPIKIWTHDATARSKATDLTVRPRSQKNHANCIAGIIRNHTAQIYSLLTMSNTTVSVFIRQVLQEHVSDLVWQYSNKCGQPFRGSSYLWRMSSYHIYCGSTSEWALLPASQKKLLRFSW